MNGGEAVNIPLRLGLLAELIGYIVAVQSATLTALREHLKRCAVRAVARHQNFDGLVLADERLEGLVVATVGGHVERRPSLPVSYLDRFVSLFCEHGFEHGGIPMCRRSMERRALIIDDAPFGGRKRRQADGLKEATLFSKHGAQII